MVAAPGTIEGEPYRWHRLPLEVPEAPAELIAWLTETPEPEATQERAPRDSRTAAQKLGAWAAELAAMKPETGRNIAPNRFAFMAYQRAEAGELEHGAVTDAFTDAGLKSGLEPDKVKATLKSAGKGAKAHPRKPRPAPGPTADAPPDAAIVPRMASESSGSGGARRSGRPRKLSPEQVEVLLGVVRERPSLALLDVVDAFRRVSGVTIAAETVSKYLREAGFERVLPPRAGDTGETAERAVPLVGAGSSAAEKAKRYGYQVAHRDEGDALRYPSSLTDAEWEAVKHIFDAPGRTGRPPRVPRRVMLDACAYVLRSGCSRRMLPKDMPPWILVYRTFRRWLAKGYFELLYDELRALWRSHERRNPDSTSTACGHRRVVGCAWCGLVAPERLRTSQKA